MSRFIPGDYVRPINSEPGLPRGSVWIIRRVNAISIVELDAPGFGPGCCSLTYVKGRSFDDRNLEKVILVRGLWQAVDTFAKSAQDEIFQFGGAVTGRISSSASNLQSIPKADPVQAADKLVEQAAATLDAAKENARKVREEARAAAKAEAKRKAAAEAAKKTREEREAIASRLHKDRDLAAATSALIAELSRLHNGGAEQDAAAIIAMHVEQLQPLAKSYGYKIAKPGVIAIVVKA